MSLRDVEHGVDLWTRRCRMCPRFKASADGSRAALLALDGLEVWEARAARVLFAETQRWNGLMRTAVSLSPDGRRVAWIEGSAAHLREMDSGEERTFPLDGPATLVSFSSDSRRLAVITSASLSLRDAAGTGALWAVSHTTPEHPSEPHWSTDAGALLVQYALGTEVLDTRTGARLALFPATGASASVLSPDLRVRVVASESNWDLRPEPAPVSEASADGLQRTLRKTGLVLERAEVVAGP